MDNLSKTIKLFLNLDEESNISDEELEEKLYYYIHTVTTEDINYIIDNSKKYLFLIFDTNLLLDIIWDRDLEIVNIYNKLINRTCYSQNSEIILATTLINVMEIFDILRFQSLSMALYELKASPDVISKVYRGSPVPNKYKTDEYFMLKYHKNLCEYLEKFFKILMNFWILCPEMKLNFEEISILRDLIFKWSIRDKDTLIVLSIYTYYKLANSYNNIEGPYFLTSDNDLANALDYLLDVYNLKNNKQRKSFIDYVMKSWILDDI